MLLNFVYGLIGVALLTAFCLIVPYVAPQAAYWTMTPKVKELMEKSGVSKKLEGKNVIGLIILSVVIFFGAAVVIICAGKQGVESGMNLFQLSVRFVIFWWMVSIFDAVVLDWWMFTKTKVFGIWFKKTQGKEPPVWSIEPQWDGKEIPKLIGEVVLSVVMAWIFIKIFRG